METQQALDSAIRTLKCLRVPHPGPGKPLGVKAVTAVLGKEKGEMVAEMFQRIQEIVLSGEAELSPEQLDDLYWRELWIPAEIIRYHFTSDEAYRPCQLIMPENSCDHCDAELIINSRSELASIISGEPCPACKHQRDQESEMTRRAEAKRRIEEERAKQAKLREVIINALQAISDENVLRHDALNWLLSQDKSSQNNFLQGMAGQAMDILSGIKKPKSEGPLTERQWECVIGNYMQSITPEMYEKIRDDMQMSRESQEQPSTGVGDSQAPI